MHEERLAGSSSREMRDHENAPLTLRDIAKWCHQMALAVSHTHFEANAYHMGFKLSNFLMNDRKDLVLIDWEQSGASPSILAPEANGCWDVEIVRNSHASDEESDSTKPVLLYKKSHPQKTYGAGRSGLCPQFGGTSAQKLLKWQRFSVLDERGGCQQQVDDSEGEDLTMIEWHISASEVPESWKAVLSRCVEVDPNKRI
jgi:serine/threonine protein kinase